MSKISKKYTAMLGITISVMMILMLGIHVLSGFTNFGINFVRSGTFENVQQNIRDRGWTFSADEANGYNIIFVNMTRENLDDFLGLVITGRISEGEMQLTILQNNTSQSFYLYNHEHQTITAISNIDVSIFSYGRFEMRLDFLNATDVLVDIEW